MIGSVYLAHFRLFSTQSTTIDIQTQNTLAIDEIANTIKEARSVTTCSTFFCLPGNSSIESDPTNLVLDLRPLDNNNKPKVPPTSCVTVDTKFTDRILYNIENNKLRKKIGRGNAYFMDPTPHCFTGFASSRVPNPQYINNNWGSSGGQPGQFGSFTKYLTTDILSINFKYYDQSGQEPSPTPCDQRTGQAQIDCYKTITQVQITVTTARKAILNTANPSPIMQTQTKKVVLRNKE